ncbi:LacI family DNA-binding transcriptional regulator [Sporolactobacillus sp. CPB3-1]|uniref:LacI family DNA-binding transcriptional regulator n=1 Tax=Sporolactobacillus mangiferae TaxID=2940498 RepID=A0ABT0M968_9BACL|nr:LacI family DNA-binding transcriptional regulator [Sporolactobacillus mangiferae]MCL1631431.1 LacI family DNA-binding transcriptional regulator [Sporolactobacillus mangiferae]
MKAKPKLEDVAKAAGVSPTTVSRVLNNRGAISDKTRKRVHDAVQRLNYHPNEIARSLFVSKTHLIGIIFPSTSQPFFGEMIAQIENLLFEKNYKVLICNTMDQADKEKNYLNMLLASQVDGVIIGTHSLGIDAYLQAQLPVIAIDRDATGTVTVVRSDHYQGGRMATEELLRQGRTRIVHVNGMHTRRSLSCSQQQKGYEDAMEAHGLPCKTYNIESSLDIRAKKQLLKTMIASHLNLEGIFLSDDITAAIALSIIRKMDRDIAVVGYDGTTTVTTCLPELTTIVQPIRAMAKLTVDLLLKEISNEFSGIKRNYVLPVTLKKGE